MDQREMLALIERGVCPLCGNGPYAMVGVHVSKAHRVNAHALREMVGVSNSYVFASGEVRAKMSASYDKERGAKVREARKRGELKWSPAKRTTAGRDKNIKAITEYNEVAWALRRLLP